MSVGPTIGEVERAKSQLKASLLLSLDGTTAVAEDIGRQLVTSGRRMTPQQIENAVDAVTPDEIKRVAQKYLWDKDVFDEVNDATWPAVGTSWPLFSNPVAMTAGSRAVIFTVNKYTATKSEEYTDSANPARWSYWQWRQRRWRC